MSEPSKPLPRPGVLAWLSAADDRLLYISVLTLGEIRNGVERVNSLEKKARHEAFLARVQSVFSGRTIEISEEIAERWGRLTGTLSQSGTTLQVIDALLAATALHHDLVLVTRNERHFRVPGLSVLNPFTKV